MVKKTEKDIQLSFDFNTGERKLKFITVRCQCKCGYTGDFKKAEIVIEMTALCPVCGSVIKIK